MKWSLWSRRKYLDFEKGHWYAQSQGVKMANRESVVTSAASISPDVKYKHHEILRLAIEMCDALGTAVDGPFFDKKTGRGLD